MNKEKIIMIALIILVVLSGVQAFEIAAIKETGIPKTGQYSQESTTTTSSPTYAGPQMIGGC